MSQLRPSAPLPTPDELARIPERTSGLAIASLVLGLLGFLTGGVTGLVGIILGIVALLAMGRLAK